MATILIIVCAWIALGVFNVREFAINWLDEFGRVTRAELVFFVFMGGVLAFFSWPLSLWWFIKRRSNVRVNWDANVWTRK